MKLSIITINYNNKAGLEKTIASVMSQTWRDFEWIIIDGGSTDGSKEVIEEVAANPDSNISYWCSEPDKGIYNAMNKGIAHAKGEYLNFMNSGDCYYEKDTLGKVFMNIYTDDIIYGDALLCYPNKYQIHHFSYPVSIDYFYITNICHQAMFVKNELLQNQGYDESFHIYADWKRWISAAISGASFRFVDLIICYYDMTGIGATMFTETQKELARIREEFPPAILECKNKIDILKSKLYYYENFHIIFNTKSLVEKGGFPSLVVRFFIKILSKCFL